MQTQITLFDLIENTGGNKSSEKIKQQSLKDSPIMNSVPLSATSFITSDLVVECSLLDEVSIVGDENLFNAIAFDEVGFYKMPLEADPYGLLIHREADLITAIKIYRGINHYYSDPVDSIEYYHYPLSDNVLTASQFKVKEFVNKLLIKE